MSFLFLGEEKHMYRLGAVAGVHLPPLPQQQKNFSLSLPFVCLNPGQSFRKKKKKKRHNEME